jgi:hypothetical protein
MSHSIKTPIECNYAECHNLFIVKLNVIMLSVIMLDVAAPTIQLRVYIHKTS